MSHLWTTCGSSSSTSPDCPRSPLSRASRKLNRNLSRRFLSKPPVLPARSLRRSTKPATARVLLGRWQSHHAGRFPGGVPAIHRGRLARHAGQSGPRRPRHAGRCFQRRRRNVEILQPGLSLCQMLTMGAVAALAHHASDAIQQRYLPKMVAGEWTGTMNLTEPQAGSDLSTIRTRAEPDGDRYRLFGSKIFISWGEHDRRRKCHPPRAGPIA